MEERRRSQCLDNSSTATAMNASLQQTRQPTAFPRLSPPRDGQAALPDLFPALMRFFAPAEDFAMILSYGAQNDKFSCSIRRNCFCQQLNAEKGSDFYVPTVRAFALYNKDISPKEAEHR